MEPRREETFSLLESASRVAGCPTGRSPLRLVAILIWYKGLPASLNFLYFSPEDFKMVFTSACAITGKVRAYNKNSTKKNPMVPMNVPISTKVGENMVHADGK